MAGVIEELYLSETVLRIHWGFKILCIALFRMMTNDF